MVVADLHIHTTHSDGQLTFETLPAAAHRAGLDAVAVTDHDRIQPALDDPVVERDGLTVINGIELRVEVDEGMRLDLLGYGVSPTDRLRAVTGAIQENRIERARKMVGRVEDETGVQLDVSYEPGVGRPHIARAIEASDAPYDYRGAFRGLIGGDSHCFIRREVPTFEEGVDCLREACGIVGLAHPLRYDQSARAIALASDLDAIEHYYPYDHDTDTSPVADAAAEHDLLLTGGSDAHDDVLGRAGLDERAFEAFRRAL